MNNIISYAETALDSFAVRPFSDVDSLILSCLSFLDIPEDLSDGRTWRGMPLKELYRAEHFDRLFSVTFAPDRTKQLLTAVAASPRFRDVKVMNYVSRLDEAQEKQFSAMTFRLAPRLSYIAFRGTDGTVVGWKEDFNMAFRSPIPSQEEAIRYLTTAGRHCPGTILLGGHSKGGNLAVYAAVRVPAPVQGRITAVYSNDGPGFHPDFLRRTEYLRMEPKILSIVPKSSIVGMLLEHSADYTVVDSDQLGFFQHDGFSWQVKGREFVKLGQVNPQVAVNDRELRQWLLERPVEQREKFVDALFDVLSASGATTLSDLKADSFGAAVAAIRAMQDLDKETREGLVSFAGLLFKGNLRLVYGELREETEGRTDQLKENLRQTLEETGRRAEETGDRLKESIRQALEETGRRAEEKTEQLKESIRQTLEETEKKTEEAVRRLGLKKDRDGDI